jgi:hypothetical protein
MGEVLKTERALEEFQNPGKRSYRYLDIDRVTLSLDSLLFMKNID